MSSISAHEAAVFEQRIFLSSWRIVGDQESSHSQQLLVEVEIASGSNFDKNASGSASHFTREHISLSFFQWFLLICLPSHRAGVSEQRPSLSSCGIVGDQENGPIVFKVYLDCK